MSVNQRLGRFIVDLRHKRGLTQESLALAANIDRRYLSELENGRRNPSMAIIERIGGIFHLSACDVIAMADRPYISLAQLKESLVEHGYDESVVLDSPDFIEAVMGITDDGRVVYSRTRMVQLLMIEDDISADDAEEFLDYNTIRALPYMGELAPIIINEL